jgi:hypothetical protein
MTSLRSASLTCRTYIRQAAHLSKPAWNLDLTPLRSLFAATLAACNECRSLNAIMHELAGVWSCNAETSGAAIGFPGSLPAHCSVGVFTMG